MKTSIACALMIGAFGVAAALAQDATAPTQSSPAKAKAAETDPLKGAFSGNLGAPTTGPITTEIYSNEAFFDSEKYIGIFSGRVIVKDPRFNIQADKLTIYLSKGEARGLERAVAEGNVGVIREAPGEQGAPPSRSVGRADIAVYTAKDGNVELKGTPRLQSGMNTHIATSPDTVMLVNQNGQLTTRGPSRTEIRQEPKAEQPKP
ncbi:MAG: hypothetical protein H0W20_14460 [Chthoniobacterales bacterium]|nr:hypothetical protein [Chthoniobacterales bacterium]